MVAETPENDPQCGEEEEEIDSAKDDRRPVVALVTQDLWDSDERVVKNALKELGNVCNSDQHEEKVLKKIRQDVCLMGGPLSIIKTMERFPKNAQINVLACTCLSILLLSYEMALTLIVRSGGVQIVLMAMKNFIDEGTVQESACHFLATVAQKTNESARVVSEAGGIPSLVAAMAAHRGKGLVHEYACEAIYNLTLSGMQQVDEIVNGCGLKALIEALDNRELSNKDVSPEKCYACKSLRELGRHGSEYQSKIIRAGGLAVLGQAVADHPKDTEMRKEVGKLLAAFAKVVTSEVPL